MYWSIFMKYKIENNDFDFIRIKIVEAYVLLLNPLALGKMCIFFIRNFQYIGIDKQYISCEIML